MVSGPIFIQRLKSRGPDLGSGAPCPDVIHYDLKKAKLFLDQHKLVSLCHLNSSSNKRVNTVEQHHDL
jgi:hypothetical protein